MSGQSQAPPDRGSEYIEAFDDAVRMHTGDTQCRGIP